MRQLTVLGSNAGFPTHGRACSGFLLEWDGFRVVLDLGYGTLAHLLNRCPDGRVDAVVITHDHPDHFIDLHGLFRLYYYGRGPGLREKKVPLFCTARVEQRLRAIEPELDPGSVFDFRELQVDADGDGGAHRIGPLELTTKLLPHFVPNLGVRLCHGSRPVVAYTGDTGPTAELAALGAGVDLFIVEATDREGETQRAERNLLTSGEAGFWAAEAGARRLLLTHFWPGNDRQLARRTAQSHFPGEILIAEEGLEVGLEDG